MKNLEPTVFKSHGLTLPLSYVTTAAAILGVRGSGKSSTAVAIAEEMYDVGLPFVVADPKGDWFGLRLDASGKKPSGIDIPIFGGPHGDVPLDKGSGKHIAALVVDLNLSCILDLSNFDSEAQMKRWLLDFAQTLYKLNKTPRHLFLDEADVYVPQSPKGGDRDERAVEPQLLRAFENIVRRGRSKGLGMTMITQRSAAINKNVITQAETLIAMRVASPNDRKVIEDWLKFHAERVGILETLSSLKSGEGWVISPDFLKTTERVQFRLRRTYDSGKTPEVGEKIVPPGKLSDINLGELREHVAAAIAKADAEDPAKLRGRIATLERELAAKPKPLIDEESINRAKAIGYNEGRDFLMPKIQHFETILLMVKARLSDALMLIPDGSGPAKLDPLITNYHLESPSQRVANPDSTAIVFNGNPVHEVIANLSPTPDTNGKITEPMKKVLNALAWWETVGIESPDRLQLAAISEYSPTSGNYSNIISKLKQSGYVDYGSTGTVTLTKEGRANALYPTKAGTLNELHDAIREKLREPQKEIFNAVVDSYPNDIERVTIAIKTGYSVTSGNFNNLIFQLKTLGWIDYPNKGSVIASPSLYPAGLR